MVSMIFELVPKSVSQKPWYQKCLQYLRIYSFIASISGLILFVAYLVTLGTKLTTAHGVMLAIAICCAIYTTITTVVICFVPSGGDIVDAVKYVMNILFFFGWGANTIILATDSVSCSGNSKRRRNDSDGDSGSGGCGVWGAVVAVSVLNLIGFLLTVVMADAVDAEKLKNPLKRRNKEDHNKDARAGDYEPISI
ncbi:hypothetical protein BKA64DRAFT_652904 [Cadophora sp. MPI-SDFR-AT-0126]|nr:hypothetical protein BKA64DRAFT_652904 [Leotiomycetes sp. MPI-SDFR-AT-0126]